MPTLPTLQFAQRPAGRPEAFGLNPAIFDREQRRHYLGMQNAEKHMRNPIRSLFGAANGHMPIYALLFSSLMAVAGGITALFMLAQSRYRRHLGQVNQAAGTFLNMALYDRLTGAYNRQVYDNALENHFNAALRSGKPLSVIYLDLDRFKGINDEFGHAAGDQSIQAFAGAIGEAVARVSPGGLVCRIGGDEFSVILPDTGKAGAEETAEAIREQVSNIAIPVASRAEPVRLTTSQGICTLNGASSGPKPDAKPVTVPTDLTKIADEAMLAAKKAGRSEKNRGIIHHELGVYTPASSS